MGPDGRKTMRNRTGNGSHNGLRDREKITPFRREVYHRHSHGALDDEGEKGSRTEKLITAMIFIDI